MYLSVLNVMIFAYGFYACIVIAYISQQWITLKSILFMQSERSYFHKISYLNLCVKFTGIFT